VSQSFDWPGEKIAIAEPRHCARQGRTVVHHGGLVGRWIQESHEASFSVVDDAIELMDMPCSPVKDVSTVKRQYLAACGRCLPLRRIAGAQFKDHGHME
jgi:hypothetical protein